MRAEMCYIVIFPMIGMLCECACIAGDEIQYIQMIWPIL